MKIQWDSWIPLGKSLFWGNSNKTPREAILLWPENTVPPTNSSEANFKRIRVGTLYECGHQNHPIASIPPTFLSSCSVPDTYSLYPQRSVLFIYKFYSRPILKRGGYSLKQKTQIWSGDSSTDTFHSSHLLWAQCVPRYTYHFTQSSCHSSLTR